MRLVFKCHEACLFFDDINQTYVVVEKEDLEIIVTVLEKELINSDDIYYRFMILTLLKDIRKRKCYTFF